jgi:hypothetical protein
VGVLYFSLRRLELPIDVQLVAELPELFAQLAE